jgi:hypothetical protein
MFILFLILASSLFQARPHLLQRFLRPSGPRLISGVSEVEHWRHLKFILSVAWLVEGCIDLLNKYMQREQVSEFFVDFDSMMSKLHF